MSSVINTLTFDIGIYFDLESNFESFPASYIFSPSECLICQCSTIVSRIFHICCMFWNIIWNCDVSRWIRGICISHSISQCIIGICFLTVNTCTCTIHNIFHRFSKFFKYPFTDELHISIFNNFWNLIVTFEYPVSFWNRYFSSCWLSRIYSRSICKTWYFSW